MSAQTIHKSQKVSKADVVFNIILYGICGLILLLIAYPLYFIIIASFSNPSEVSNGNVWFWPSQFTLDGYKELLRHGSIWMGYWNTILYTVVGTAIGLIVNISAAYSLSRRDLVGRKLITFYSAQRPRDAGTEYRVPIRHGKSPYVRGDRGTNSDGVSVVFYLSCHTCGNGISQAGKESGSQNHRGRRFLLIGNDGEYRHHRRFYCFGILL